MVGFLCLIRTTNACYWWQSSFPPFDTHSPTPGAEIGLWCHDAPFFEKLRIKWRDDVHTFIKSGNYLTGAHGPENSGPDCEITGFPWLRPPMPVFPDAGHTVGHSWLLTTAQALWIPGTLGDCKWTKWLLPKEVVCMGWGGSLETWGRNSSSLLYPTILQCLKFAYYIIDAQHGDTRL